MIGIVNYGLGNVQALANLYQRLNIPVRICTSPQALLDMDRLILPGVGAFDWAMQKLDEGNFRAVLNELVLERKVPILGICVGMQMMTLGSEEGTEKGLGWFDATVQRFSFTEALPLPHMGWNTVDVPQANVLFRSFIVPPQFYFLHSYHFLSHNKQYAIGHTRYGYNFTCAIQNENIFAVQFHPEKSHHWGEALLKQFAEFEVC